MLCRHWLKKMKNKHEKRHICSKVIFTAIFLITALYVIRSFFPIYLTSEQIDIFSKETGMTPMQAYGLLKESQNMNFRYNHFVYGVSQGEYIITTGLMKNIITTRNGYWINPKTKKIRKVVNSHFIMPIIMRDGILSFPQSYEEIFITVIDAKDPLSTYYYSGNY